MDRQEGRCYKINNHAGMHIGPGDQSIAADLGKKVRIIFRYPGGVVQVVDLDDPRSMFNIQEECLDPL